MDTIVRDRKQIAVDAHVKAEEAGKVVREVVVARSKDVAFGARVTTNVVKGFLRGLLFKPQA